MVAFASSLSRAAELAGSYLNLIAGVLSCAIPLRRALGVLPLEQITPRCRPEPTFGQTVELQGQTIPLVTVSGLLGLAAPPLPTGESRACVLFVQVHAPSGPTCVGLVLGAPPDALYFGLDDICVPADPGTPFIMATAHQCGRTFPLLDLDAVWSAHRPQAGMPSGPAVC